MTPRDPIEPPDAPLEPGTDLAPDGLPPLRDVIRAHDLMARKSLGQNFILDFNLTRRIARTAGPLEGRTVIEVGPGPGGLTRALFMEGAERVIAIERDERCLPALAAIAARYPGRLSVIAGDALEADWPRLLGSDKAIIVSNLPYNIATLLLVGWMECEPWPPWWDRMALMFQREVADRIVAAPHSKAYGRLSIISQWRAQVRINLTLRPEAFTPPPKVASAVVSFVPLPEPNRAPSVKMLGRITAAAFSQRRKMLRASLRQLLGDPLPLLDAAGIAPELRAEQLAVADFVRLATVFETMRGERA
jgi:16S rRNA (adenine1518-N6/adenine1519-N6)-dimethyltransferase